VCLDSPRKWRAQHPDYWRKCRDVSYVASSETKSLTL
jgi:hypothetical protein